MPIAGRTVTLRVWELQVGRIKVYLLDSNVPENSEADRALTARLYGGNQELRIQQYLILGVGGVAGYHRQRRLEQEELENAARSKKRPRKVGGSGRRAPVPVPSAAAFSPSSHAARALAIGTALCGAGALLLAGAVAGAMGVSSLREFGDVMRDRIGPRVRAALGVRRDPTIEAEKAQLATLTPDQEEAHWRRVFERAAADDPKSKPPA